ncbi:MAG: (2Fe-2S)-binding protein [Bryobacteraceae bacterium]|nr:(2Fe-2S)-binding protein [Bryobacteraceae bacterium]
MPVYRFTVNGRPHSVDAPASRPLLEVLREDLDLTGTKYGCGEGQCRACTVLIDGRPSASCVTPVRNAAGRNVTTIEGLAGAGGLTPVQRAFLEQQAFQCGYCTPGMVLGAAALLERTPSPSEEQIREGLNGHICRCTGYPRIVEAVQLAARLSKEAKSDD